MIRSAICALLLGATACALTSKAPPLDVSFYAPEIAPPPASDGPASTGKIRLGRVIAGSHLREHIAYRASPIRIGFYEERRWTEPPEAYVRRALEHALFSRGVLVTGGEAVQLEVEVLSFEEVRAPRPAGRVGLRYRLIDDREVIEEGLIEVERPARGDFGSIVVAIGDALEEASTRMSVEVVDRVETVSSKLDDRRARTMH